MAEHVAVCPQCHELFQHAAQLGHGLASLAVEVQNSALDEQLARAEAAIREERGVRAFLRSRSTRVRWLMSLGLPALLLLFELSRRRLPWASFSASRLLGGVVLLALLALVARSALRPLPADRSAARLRSLLALVAWCLPCVLWFAPEARASSDEFSANFALRSFACFAYSGALAAPAFALFWVLDRGVEVPFRVWALAAGVAGLVANLILVLHCPNTNRAHLVAGHFSIGLGWFLAAFVGQWWRRRV